MRRTFINIILRAVVIAAIAGLGQLAGHANPASALWTKWEGDHPMWVAFSHDSELVATGTRDAAVHIFDVRNGKNWLVNVPQLNAAVTCLAFSPTFQSSTGGLQQMMAVATADGAVTLILGNGTPIRLCKRGFAATALAMGGGHGECLAAGFSDGNVLIWKRNAAGDDQAPISRSYYASPVLSLAFQGDQFAIGYKNSKIALLPDVTYPRPTLLQDHSDAVNSLAFSSDNRWLASASNDRSVIVWNTQTHDGTAYHYDPDDNSAVKSVAIYTANDDPDTPSPFGYMAAAYTNGVIGLWGVRAGGSLNTIGTLLAPTSDGAAYCIAISPDGRYLASVSADNKLHVWQLPSQPAAPANVVARAHDGRNSLRWDASRGAASYNVYRGTKPDGEDATPLIENVPDHAFVDRNVTDATTYYYKVAAVNAGGASLLSSEASTAPQFRIPAVPTRPAATPGNAQVSLLWTATAGATSYNVYRSTAEDAGGTLVEDGITRTRYTDTGLSNGTAYYYEVAAVNDTGTSALSRQTTAIPIELIEAESQSSPAATARGEDRSPSGKDDPGSSTDQPAASPAPEPGHYYFDFDFDDDSLDLVKTNLTVTVNLTLTSLTNGSILRHTWSVTGAPNHLGNQNMQMLVDLPPGRYEYTLIPKCSGTMAGTDAPVLTANPVVVTNVYSTEGIVSHTDVEIHLAVDPNGQRTISATVYHP
ncbi:MAG: fibronectin type III domain-containing protein [Capsulimonadaceae bacterium]